MWENIFSHKQSILLSQGFSCDLPLYIEIGFIFFYFSGFLDPCSFLFLDWSTSDSSLFNPTRRGAFKAPPWTKMAISALFLGPIEPKKFDFSYKPMRMPIIAIWLLKMPKKRDFYSIFVVGIRAMKVIWYIKNQDSLR